MLTACRKNGKGTGVQRQRKPPTTRAQARSRCRSRISAKYGRQIWGQSGFGSVHPPEFISAYFAVSAIGAVAVPMNTF